ncbi:MAG: ferredoxin-type protein NapF [Gammaproteobacteria bacterium]|nr:ferredoxin-type protein NapF [Gammaproteobacteria bacterium]
MQFLSGDYRASRAPVRPPWAIPENLFADTCTRCGDCIPACPEGLITKGRGGFPVLDFKRGGCDFCRECVSSCQPRALTYDPVTDPPPWDLKATFLNSCLSLNSVVCRSCGEVCDTQAIRYELRTGGNALVILDQERCTGCGLCFAVCPNGSIKILPTGSRGLAA